MNVNNLLDLYTDYLMGTPSYKVYRPLPTIRPFKMAEIDLDENEMTESTSGLVPITKRHGSDIEFRKNIQWSIDYLQMGVGDDTSWGRLVHPEYTIPANQIYEYEFILDPRGL